MKKLLLGTGNKGKIAELKDILRELECDVVGLDEFEPIIEPEETGITFQDNACLKAEYYARAFSCPTLADDSGLVVANLGGKPGVRSSRFAGENATDAENNEKLLGLLKNAETSQREAEFVCVVALADETGEILKTTEGRCAGRIAAKPSGHNGFGYDPLFIPTGFDATFGDLPNSVKMSLSHRSKAARKMAEFLVFNSGMLT